MLRAIGNVEASEIVIIKSQISGELTKVNFKEGQDVQKGAILFQLDNRPYIAALKKAEAALARNRVIMENARTNYDRYRLLVKDGIVTAEQAEGYRTTAESAEASVAADQAEVENARAQLAYCTIKAPTSGRLGILAVHQGNVVKANDMSLVTINRISPIKVLFAIPEKELSDIKKQLAGGKVAVEAEVTGTNGFTEKGVIDFLDNTVETSSGTIKLKGIFENIKKRLWPGQMVNISITMNIRKNAVIVPTQAIQTGQQGQYLLVVKQDLTAELRPVTVGPVQNGNTVIEKGLQPGEQVIIDGQVRVIPGSKVEIKAGTGDQGRGTGDLKPATSSQPSVASPQSPVPSPQSPVPNK
jgi:multidrug efflux system membrane fusion protein